MAAYAEAFAVIAELAEVLGVRRINQHPGCWEMAIDDRWWVAVNGHATPIECSRSGVPVQPFHGYIEYNGWPAGIINPHNGIIAAGAGEANEQGFIAAVRARIERTRH